MAWTSGEQVQSDSLDLTRNVFMEVFMWSIITNKKDIFLFQRVLEFGLKNAVDKSLKCPVGHQGHSSTLKVFWSNRLGFWFGAYNHKNKPIPKFWNAFGLQEPNSKKTLSIDCEINIPFNGIQRNIGAAFAEDGRGNVSIIHRGIIGGGRKGVGKIAFFNHYKGKRIIVNDGDRDSEVALVAIMNSSTWVKQIANFVYEVARIKNEIVHG